jgi:hypothetical protein
MLDLLLWELANVDESVFVSQRLQAVHVDERTIVDMLGPLPENVRVCDLAYPGNTGEIRQSPKNTFLGIVHIAFRLCG